ncbi:MAG: hypothetical protein JXB32_03720 [Deltaproteobacteria bacterium]|nr:hypothetical protein [Deltaproteobacteria bacterium]
MTIYGIALAVAIGAVVLGVDLLTQTDEERIEKVLDEMRSAAAGGRSDRLASLFDLEGDGFEVAIGRERERFGSDDVAALEDYLADGFEWLGDAALRLEGTTVEVSGERAHAYFRVVLLRSDSADQSVPIDLTLRRDGDDWRVTRFRALSTAGERSARR